MSTLDQELSFIRSYSRLLETRHGEGFKLKLDIEPNATRCELPALSLQLLVENAVKHNVISKTDPVTVWIRTANDRLWVENNLKPKARKPESTGIGLANIRDKYRLLHREDVIIENNGQKFLVSLPLLPGNN